LIEFTASKIAMCTIAIARLERPGPSCSPNTRSSPAATGVRSRPLASTATWFQQRSLSAAFVAWNVGWFCVAPAYAPRG
jgi:hypothetical protein